MPHPIFLLILNALYKGFQMRYHLFQKFFGKIVKIKEASFLFTNRMYDIAVRKLYLVRVPFLVNQSVIDTLSRAMFEGVLLHIFD